MVFILPLQHEIENHEDDFKRLIEDGPKWVQDESDLQQKSLKEQLEALEKGWKDLSDLWDKRQKLLIMSLNHQVSKKMSSLFQCGATLYCETATVS